MVSLRDTWINPAERKRLLELASKIDALGKALIDGVEYSTRKDADPPNNFFRCYINDRITVEHSGPKDTPTQWSFCTFVRYDGRLATRQINTDPAIIECDLDVAENVLSIMETMVEEEAARRRQGDPNAS